MTGLTLRTCQQEDDYWRIRAFLREVYLCNGRHELGWQASRLDYWRWHMVENVGVLKSWMDGCFLWEDQAGCVKAVLNADNQAEAILTIHPDTLTPESASEMLTFAEQRFGVSGSRATPSSTNSNQNGQPCCASWV